MYVLAISINNVFDIHQENMFVKCIPPYTPQTGVCRGTHSIPYFLTFYQKQTSWVLVGRVPAMYVMSENFNKRTNGPVNAHLSTGICNLS